MSDHTRDIHGHTVHGEDDAVKGLEHLDNDLDSGEAKALFDQARYRGQAQFEDDEDRNYTLTYDDGRYTVTRRKSSGGGWWPF